MLEPVAPSLNDCAHHWILMAPSGNSTNGTCKHCGETRQFNDANQAPGRYSHRTKAKT